MNTRFVSITLLSAMTLTMAGCASNQVPIRARGPSGGMQGSAWELVTTGPDVTRALAALPPGDHPAYMSRRDAALGATTPSWAPVASAAEARPSIAYQRSIYLRRSHDSFLFFTSPGAWPATPWPYTPHWPPHHHSPSHPTHNRHWNP